ncbi:M20/M25/M40 family metallo-hydrolase [Brevibacillus choshinensis]|uniref:M20/M25/M40 family metallo-hydrolase n=1 Tax=Brevibacillus choshinensis TaxID=54911 RepID=UPI002E1E2FCA|nr:M20/M25/M40 family metallo-hydrolase [Brevibacillus choshinensis]MED4751582.1 M20/M25/M40 family metallo-hydrolase [Brevibacillus choshinensis]MED4780181.1 M20/M25/M40 family metallo-hydrolase [Brevibacillus choshinensis]
MGKWQTKEQLVDLLCNIVSIPSVTGSLAEKQLPGYVVEQLRSLPYYQAHPDHVRANPTEDGRHFVTALVKKEGARDTIILVSHFDVVDVEDYGAWRTHAFDPQTLTPLFQANAAEMPAEVRHDLNTGNWLFGRGTMDMKCGLTLHMSMIERACEGEFEGNILLLTVPDEEVNSVGMRAAVPALLALAEEFDLSYKTVLNSEPMFTRFPGDQNKYLYTGSIGKVLPGFLCYGKETHVGEPFAGLNGNYMASQLTCELELNTSFCEVVEGEASPPPTNLIQKDLKKEYSVQIPHRAVTLFNLFLLEKRMEDVVEPLLQSAKKVAEQIKQTYVRHATQFAANAPFAPRELSINVLTYEQLHAYATKTYGEDRLIQLQADVVASRGEKDDRDMTIELVDQLAILCKELSPMIILFFAPPFYPAVSSRNHPVIQRVAAEMEAYAREQHKVTLVNQNYFGGISDLSYVGLQYPAASMQPLVANMPMWDRGYSIPLQELEAFDVPVMNLGPVGRDAHQWTERLDVDYAFDTLMDMLPRCIHSLLK